MAHMLPFSATASVDGQLLIWDTATLSVRATCQHPEVSSAQGPPLPELCALLHSPCCTPLPPAAYLVLSLSVGALACEDCVSIPWELEARA